MLNLTDSNNSNWELCDQRKADSVEKVYLHLRVSNYALTQNSSKIIFQFVLWRRRVWREHFSSPSSYLYSSQPSALSEKLFTLQRYKVNVKGWFASRRPRRAHKAASTRLTSNFFWCGYMDKKKRMEINWKSFFILWNFRFFFALSASWCK